MKYVAGSFIIYLVASGKLSTYARFATVASPKSNSASASNSDRGVIHDLLGGVLGPMDLINGYTFQDLNNTLTNIFK